MSVVAFDALAYFERLKTAGVPEAQAKVLAEGMKSQSEAIHEAIRNYDETRQKEVVTKGDLENTRLALKKDMLEMQLKLEKEIEEVRGEIKSTELRLLKWQTGIAITILLVMAKGFNWLGF